jgi:hypothetical protein
MEASHKNNIFKPKLFLQVSCLCRPNHTGLSHAQRGLLIKRCGITGQHTNICHMASERRRKQAELEFNSAIAALTQILPNGIFLRLSQLDRAVPVISDPQVTSISAHVSQLEEAINSVLRPTKVDKPKDPKVEKVVTRWLRVSYPFSRLFLNVAKIRKIDFLQSFAFWIGRISMPLKPYVGKIIGLIQE